MPDFFGKTVSAEKIARVVAAYQEPEAGDPDTGEVLPPMTLPQVKTEIAKQMLESVRAKVIKFEQGVARAALAAASEEVTFDYE